MWQVGERKRTFRTLLGTPPPATLWLLRLHYFFFRGFGGPGGRDGLAAFFFGFGGPGGRDGRAEFFFGFGACGGRDGVNQAIGAPPGRSASITGSDAGRW